jgi:hypothetical protein
MNATNRQSMLALAAAFALCILASADTLRYARYYLAPSKQDDFGVYFVAANVVHQRLSSHLYDDAGTGVDPQLRFASDDSVFARTARSVGISHTKLYVYPPFLADALLPFTRFSLATGMWVWRYLSLFAVVASAGMVSRLLGFKVRSIPSLVVLAGLLSFSPLWQGLHYGQITMVLLALWSAGILLYTRGWRRTSALILSAAALVKISPLLAVVPILIWRDWRWVRWFAGGIAAGCLLMCFENSPGTLLFYLRHVVPPMSVGIVSRQNKTVLSAVGMIWCRGLDYPGMAVPQRVVLMGKLLCAGLVGAAAFLANRSGRNLQTPGRAMVLAAFALLSLCVSPVTWLDALAIGYILLALLWKRMFDGGRPLAELLLLLAATVSMGTCLALGDEGFTFLQYAPLILAVLLALYVLGGLGRMSPGNSASYEQPTMDYKGP